VSARTWLGAALVVCLAIAVAGCTPDIENMPLTAAMTNAVEKIPGVGNTTGLDVHAVRSIKAVIVRKIAVMSLIEVPDQVDKEFASGAGESISAALYAKASLMGGWQVVPQDDVEQAMQQLPPTNAGNLEQNAIALGKKVNADGVIYGTVTRYRDRVGYEFAASTSAAVAMTLYFLDEKSGQVVWTAKYAREQKTLSENFLDLPRFLENRGRWVRAYDIASEGVEGALTNLQSKVTIEPVVQGQY
jgi:hypothetical protein